MVGRDRVLVVGGDAASRGALAALMDGANTRRAAEQRARERLRVADDAGRGKSHSRPASTYRQYKRNTARFNGWPDRRRYRTEEHAS